MVAPVSRLGRQIAEVTAALRGIGAQFALIGGLALASHNVVRGTQDVDLLVDAVREYFQLFNRMELLDELLREID